MLDELHVQNLALIREASFLPASGLTVITGETGSGKTAVLSALALLAGERADASTVRDGSNALQVEGRFVFEHGLQQDGRAVVAAQSEAADAYGREAPVCGPVEMAITRQVGVDGRSRVHIDGAIASVGQLADGVGATIDLCGQHEHQHLMKVANHRSMLDAWAHDTIGPALEAYFASFARAKDAAEALEDLRASGSLSSNTVEQARFVLARINEISPEEGEYETLQAELARAENADALARQLGGAHEALSQDGGALDAIGSALAFLEEAAQTDPSLLPVLESLREASYGVEDASRDARKRFEGINYDAQELARMQERMANLQGLLRSFGPTMDEVFAARNKAEEAIASVGDFDALLAAAQKRRAQAEEELALAAAALFEARDAAAPRFAEAASAQMQRLELHGASLECAHSMLGRSQWGPSGPDSVELLFKPAEGIGARPLVRIASGGEVSRVMLAIKVTLGAADHVETLVFDEVDAGVGGSSARALAEVLADLARTHQVIVVTHLAQVAVLGDVHYVVRKTDGAMPETLLEAVSGQARVAEVARMLSGDASGVSRAHAAKMLEEAHQLHTG